MPIVNLMTVAEFRILLMELRAFVWLKQYVEHGFGLRCEPDLIRRAVEQRKQYAAWDIRSHSFPTSSLRSAKSG